MRKAEYDSFRVMVFRSASSSCRGLGVGLWVSQSSGSLMFWVYVSSGSSASFSVSSLSLSSISCSGHMTSLTGLPENAADRTRVCVDVSMIWLVVGLYEVEERGISL